MRARRLPVFIYATALTLFSSTLSTRAGMTVYGLRDIYRMRLEEISFFIVLLAACSFFFQLLWNYAVKGFNFLPRLKFRQSVCLSILFGLLMLLILTMISGIREVLTPGAWRHQGTSYRLNDPSQEPARRRGLEQLRSALFDYAKLHQGNFPASDFQPEISEKLWEAPDQIGTHYIYSGGLTTNDVGRVLAVESLNFGDQRFVLFVSGELRSLSKAEIENLLSRKGPQ
ncbi:MAG: hypothetical protein ABIR24_05555 [Verrucomicrobiota bacterium]